MKINWDDEWSLVERVPENLVKIEYPNKYEIVPSDTSMINSIITPQMGEYKNIYIPALDNIELILSFSEDQEKENFYKILEKIGYTVLAFGLLFLAR